MTDLLNWLLNKSNEASGMLVVNFSPEIREPAGHAVLYSVRDYLAFARNSTAGNDISLDITNITGDSTIEEASSYGWEFRGA
ncbi:MAG: hypothetical protein FWH38_05185 [Treponema sp.]|nr:hypothetical protein [Treponema sp.]